MPETSDAIALACDRLRLELVPGIGGSVANFRLDDIDLFRPLSDADRSAGNVLGVAMFPMLPYANRIAANNFQFAGKPYVFHANNPPEAFNVHGTGWRRPWTVTQRNATEAVLELEVAEPDEPYAYLATQHFVLTSNGLAVTLRLKNAGDVTMPFGFGLHPWLPRDPDATVQFGAHSFYLEEPEGISGDRISLPPELDFRTARGLPRGWRNNDYGGWEGSARLTFRTRAVELRLQADPVYRHLMVYADPTKPYFCIEPQTHASGAFNRPEGFTDSAEGVIILAPGESAEGTVHFGALRL